MSVKTMVESGVTLKKRNERGQWQERWFVRTDKELRYYESSKKTKDAKGVIKLAGILQARSTPAEPRATRRVRDTHICHLPHLATGLLGQR